MKQDHDPLLTRVRALQIFFHSQASKDMAHDDVSVDPDGMKLAH